MDLEFIKKGKRRQVSNVYEYFVTLYCRRRNLVPCSTYETLRAWKLLSSAEKQIFTEKYENWQAENEKQLFNILGKAEPFLKKRTATDKVNVKSQLKETEGINNGNRNHSIIDLGNTIGNHSNADPAEQTNGESTKQENLYAELEKYEIELVAADNILDVGSESSNQENLCAGLENYEAEPILNLPDDAADNISPVGSELYNQFDAASVIGRAESTVPQGHVAVSNEKKMIEPVAPPLTTSRELFETIKSSGALPELATVEWTDMTAQEKSKYTAALKTLKKEYIRNYEQYLNSLSDQDLFKHYINKLPY